MTLPVLVWYGLLALMPAPPVDVVVVRWPFTWGVSDTASLLCKEVVARFDSGVVLHEVDHGSSRLAKLHGARTYPLVFVNGAVLSGPGDISIQGGGRYVPWTERARREAFQRDLEEMIHRALEAPEPRDGVAVGETPEGEHEVPLPALERRLLQHLPSLTAAGDEQPADVALSAMVSRLERRSRRFPRHLQDQLARRFAQIRGKIAAERLLLALEQTQELLVQIRTVEVRDLDSAENEGEAREVEPVALAIWTGARDVLLSDTVELPQAAQALAEISQLSVVPLRNASRLHRTSETRTARHFLGEALGHLEFVLFTRSLSWDTWCQPMVLPPVEPLISQTESQLLEAFGGDPSLRNSRSLRGVNTYLKNARSLDRQGLRAGAWLKYLEARIQLATSLADGEPASAGELQSRWELSFREVCEAEIDGDVSVPRLFLERAEVLLAHPDADPASRRASDCILGEIVPACLPRERE